MKTIYNIFEELIHEQKEETSIYNRKLNKVIKELKKKKKVLLLSTSNRWEGDKEIPKSTQLANHIKEMVGKDIVTLLDIPKLNIYSCEGNISTARGNTCGLKESILKNKEKNPSGYHRCWASINNKDDELWKISKELFESDVVIFFGSVRWGQMNAYYQKLIERLSWIENRYTTLNETNIVKDIEAGIIITGQNWRGEEVLNTQKDVLKFYGFKITEYLCFNWQYTKDFKDESNKSYKNTLNKFLKNFKLK
jgi:multimeric flavodoxin WrbA